MTSNRNAEQPYPDGQSPDRQAGGTDMDTSSTGSEKERVQVPFRTIAHFYDPDDPSPEGSRELSDRAESAILHAVLDTRYPLKARTRSRLEISLPAADYNPGREKDIAAAIRAHFLTRAGELGRDRRLTWKIGMREFRLTVGVCIPAFSIIVLADRFPHEPVALILQNVMVIFSWVVIWQPFQALVFDRWTQSEQAKVCREIAGMDISVVAS
jgi:hypothetical protein